MVRNLPTLLCWGWTTPHRNRLDEKPIRECPANKLADSENQPSKETLPYIPGYINEPNWKKNIVCKADTGTYKVHIMIKQGANWYSLENRY